MARPRTHCPIDRWPEEDRSAFEHAFETRGLFDAQGQAAHWALHTRLSVLKAYGYWLAFLISIGELIEQMGLSERMTLKRLAEYVRHMQPHLAPCTVVTRVRDLGEACGS
jgi:hypothetical protein